MDKDTLRNNLFESYFDEKEGVTATDLVNKLSFIPQTWEKLHILCQKNIRHFSKWNTLECFKEVKYKNKRYLILKEHSWNYTIIDIEKQKCITREQLKETFEENFFIENFEEQKQDIDLNFSKYYIMREYHGDIQELVDFYFQNEAIFSLPTRLSYRLGTEAAWTFLTIDFANGKGYMGFRTPDQFLYEHLFLNYNLTPSGMQDSQRKIGTEKIMEMFRRIPSIKIPKDRIPEKLLAEYEKRVNQENEKKNNIVDFLNTTIQSGENALILINEEKEDTLEFEIMGKQKKEKKFNLENKNIAELLYDGICQVAPDATITFMNVDAFGKRHDTVIIDISENVKAMIVNNTHQYDSFIESIKTLTKEEFYVGSEPQPAMYSKKIKPRTNNNQN